MEGLHETQGTRSGSEGFRSWPFAKRLLSAFGSRCPQRLAACDHSCSLRDDVTQASRTPTGGRQDPAPAVGLGGRISWAASQQRWHQPCRHPPPLGKVSHRIRLVHTTSLAGPWDGDSAALGQCLWLFAAACAIQTGHRLLSLPALSTNKAA